MIDDLAFHRNARRILVTGAKGAVATRILPELARQFEITPTDLGESDLPGFEAADLTDYRQAHRLMEGIDAVVHLAVATGEGRAKEVPPEDLDPVDERILRVNPSINHNILEAAARHRVRRVVYASSLTIVLADKDLPHYPTTMPPDPTNLYACTKLFGEQLAHLQWRRNGLSTICLRIGQPTPIGSHWDEDWKHNRRGRSFRVHISDVARGILAALRTRTPFGIYHLVSASDNPRVDWSAASRDLGYVPHAYFAENSLTFHPNGNFPATPK